LKKRKSMNMQQKKNQIDKIDEALRILWLDAGVNTSESDASKQLTEILNEPVHIEMPAEDHARLMSDLFITMSTMSLGEVAVEKMRSLNISTKSLAEQVKLSEERIEQIKNDEIYPNSIPVVLLKDFLEKLKVKFNMAEKGIMKTFEMVLSRLIVPAVECRPVFRRASSREISEVGGALRKTKSDLYENKEALFNYLNKLEELMEKK
jgi:hypothetical protein